MKSMKEKKEKTKQMHEMPANEKHSRAKESAPKHISLNWFYVIKTVTIALLFLGATIFFAYVCDRIQNEYLALLMDPQANLALAIMILAAILALCAATGILVALVRPVWLGLICFLTSALLLVEIMGISVSSLIITAVYLLFATTYSQSVTAKLGNQIKFTLHPLADGQRLSLLVLVLIVSAAFGLGYYNDSVNRNFIIPPEIKTEVSKSIIRQAADGIDKMETKPSEEEIKIAMAKANENVDKMWKSLEDQIMVAKFPLMPVMMGSLLMTVLQILMIFISWVPLVLMQIIFSLLKVTRFSKILTETREVETLTLE